MKKLQDDFPNFKVLTLIECLNELYWAYEENNGEYSNVKCDCGGQVVFGGWESSNEHGYCTSCGKGMQDLLAIIPTGEGTQGKIKTDNYDISDNRHWIPNNIWEFK